MEGRMSRGEMAEIHHMGMQAIILLRQGATTQYMNAAITTVRHQTGQ
jgi:hypothetical protein